MALELATQCYDVVVHYDRSHQDAEEQAQEILDGGRRAEALQCDLLDIEAVAQLVPRAVAARRFIPGQRTASLFGWLISSRSWVSRRITGPGRIL